MSEELKAKLLGIAEVGAWVAVSAGVTYVLTALLNVPELAPYYGLINVVLFAIKTAKK